MDANLKTIRRVTTGALIAFLALLVLQAFGYGIGFTLNPAAGVGEFGIAPPAVVDDLTVGLIGLVGIAMLGSAVFLILAAILIWLTNPVGVVIAGTVGGAYVLVGLSAFRAGWGWDGYFYIITGLLLIFLSAMVGWLQAQAMRDTN